MKLAVFPGVVLATLLLIPTLGCATACPSASFSGTLAAHGDELVATQEGSEAIERLIWPGGYSIRRDGESLVVTDVLGIAKARSGDRVRLGGGEITGPGVWTVCGMIEVVEP